MIALLRIAALALVVLTVIYFSVSLYSRAIRRGKLERLWEENGRVGDRESFVRDGLTIYDQSLRRRLILGVYVVPIVIVGAIVYFVNYA